MHKLPRPNIEWTADITDIPADQASGLMQSACARYFTARVGVSGAEAKPEFCEAAPSIAHKGRVYARIRWFCSLQSHGVVVARLTRIDPHFHRLANHGLPIQECVDTHYPPQPPATQPTPAIADDEPDDHAGEADPDMPACHLSATGVALAKNVPVTRDGVAGIIVLGPGGRLTNKLGQVKVKWDDAPATWEDPQSLTAEEEA
jgi:hypothetical protein